MLLKFLSDQLKLYSDMLNTIPFKQALSSINSFKWDNYYRETKGKLKDLTGTNYNLALFHLNAGNINDAIMRFKITSYMDKQNLHPDIEYYLGLCYYMKFKYDDSKHHLSSYLKSDKSEKFEEAEFLLEAIENKIDETKFIPDFLASIYYNQLAVTYGKSLEIHEKEALDILLTSILSIITTKKNSAAQKILDIGCKTGGVGSSLKEKGVESVIDGIETAKAMLEKAQESRFQEKPVYSSLQCCNINTYISTTSALKKFDIIISHDALNTTPSLSPLLQSLSKILYTKGFIALSLRTTENKKWSFNNLPCRFSFNREYLLNQIKEAGLKTLSESEISFQNGDKGVAVIITK